MEETSIEKLNHYIQLKKEHAEINKQFHVSQKTVDQFKKLKREKSLAVTVLVIFFFISVLSAFFIVSVFDSQLLIFLIVFILMIPENPMKYNKKLNELKNLMIVNGKKSSAEEFFNNQLMIKKNHYKKIEKQKSTIKLSDLGHIDSLNILLDKKQILAIKEIYILNKYKFKENGSIIQSMNILKNEDNLLKEIKSLSKENSISLDKVEKLNEQLSIYKNKIEITND